MSWSLISSSSPSSGRTYARPLGLNETSFYYDRIFNGTADIIWRYVVQPTDRAKNTALFSDENVQRAWAALKQWYPLLAVRMDDSNGMDAIKFVVSEQTVNRHQPDEVVLRTVSSPAEVDALIWRLIRDDPMSDHHLISRLFVFACQDRPGTYEVLFRAAHSIADGISGATIARTFFDVLTSPPGYIPPLEERLAMALPYDQLNPTNQMSPARQRWRRAIARVTFLNLRRKLAVSPCDRQLLRGEPDINTREDTQFLENSQTPPTGHHLSPTAMAPGSPCPRLLPSWLHASGKG